MLFQTLHLDHDALREKIEDLVLLNWLNGRPAPCLCPLMSDLPGLRVLDFKETDTDYHVKAQPTVVSSFARTVAIERNRRSRPEDTLHP